MATLEDQLEAIKRQGNYAVTLHYGSVEIGLDDCDQTKMERPIRVSAVPGGYCGGLRELWVAGSLSAFLKMDVAARPRVVSNPPRSKDIEKPGIYLWGTDEMVSVYSEKNYGEKNP